MTQHFSNIWQRAADRKGGEQALRALLPQPLPALEELMTRSDAFFLGEMTKAIFKAGFVWRVIDKKWSSFEKAFWGFDVPTCMHLSEEDIDGLCRDESIVRNRQKIVTVPKNAMMIMDIQQNHGSFANWLAQWPVDDFFGLLDYLKKHGSRLGGNSCQYFLRFAGKDGFMLTNDVLAALNQAGVVDRSPGSKADKLRVQQAYNLWCEQSGLSMAEVNRVLALSTDS